MTATTPVSLRWRVHWATCELDACGEIDEHATMCLRHAIDAACTGRVEIVLVDLRDLPRSRPPAWRSFARTPPAATPTASISEC